MQSRTILLLVASLSSASAFSCAPASPALRSARQVTSRSGIQPRSFPLLWGCDLGSTPLRFRAPLESMVTWNPRWQGVSARLPAHVTARGAPRVALRMVEEDLTDAGRRELKDLEGKWSNVCVLGGSKGVGREVVNGLSAMGVNVTSRTLTHPSSRFPRGVSFSRPFRHCPCFSGAFRDDAVIWHNWSVIRLAYAVALSLTVFVGRGAGAF